MEIYPCPVQPSTIFCEKKHIHRLPYKDFIYVGAFQDYLLTANGLFCLPKLPLPSSDSGTMEDPAVEESQETI
jgi:hypothetical protein